MLNNIFKLAAKPVINSINIAVDFTFDKGTKLLGDKLFAATFAVSCLVGGASLSAVIAKQTQPYFDSTMDYLFKKDAASATPNINKHSNDEGSLVPKVK